jgi:thiol-disulfide isomerase/thioredoxin
MTRRVLLAAGTAAVGVTVAGAIVLRKPARPVIHTEEVPAQDGPEKVPLEDMSALVPTEPPRPVAQVVIRDASGHPQPLSGFAGRPVLLNLWATWCLPCVAELPALAALARQTAGGDGLRVVAVSTDRGGAPAVLRYFAAHGIAGLEVWTDPMGVATDALRVRGVPTTLVIGPDSRELARLEGPADWADPAARVAIGKLVATAAR